MHARTVHAGTVDSPDRGPSGLEAGLSARLFLELNRSSVNIYT